MNFLWTCPWRSWNESPNISWTEQILVMNLGKQTPNCFTKSVIFERQNIYSKEWTLTGLKLTMRIFKKKKQITREQERCEVIVSNEKPLELKFHKKNEVLTVKFHYGYWNMDSMPQH